MILDLNHRTLGVSIVVIRHVVIEVWRELLHLTLQTSCIFKNVVMDAVLAAIKIKITRLLLQLDGCQNLHILVTIKNVVPNLGQHDR